MRRRDGKEIRHPRPQPASDFHGERARTRRTWPRTAAGEALSQGKGHLTKLYYMAHVLMEHRQGLPVDASFTEATGYAERETGIRLMKRHAQRTGCTLAGDKAYRHAPVVASAAHWGHPHVAQNSTRSAVGDRCAPPRATGAIGRASASASASRKACRLGQGRTADAQDAVRGYRSEAS